MSTQRYIDTSFWDDTWVQELDPSEKLLYIYLLTNPLTNLAGVMELTIKRICFDTGFNSDTVTHILRKFENAKKVYRYNNYIIIRNFPKHQQLKSENVLKGIATILSKLSDDVLAYLEKIEYQFDIRGVFDTLCIPYTYPSNYLNLDLNLDLNSNSNSDSDLSQTTEKLDNETELIQNKTEIITKTKKTKPIKHKHGEFQNVLLSDVEFNKLKTEYGEEKVLKIIQHFSELKEMKGYKYNSDYLALKKWGIESYEKRTYSANSLKEQEKNWRPDKKDLDILDKITVR